MRCVAIDAGGLVVDVDPQPVDVTLCTLVLASPAEVGTSPFTLTVEEGGLIGAAIALLWATAFGLRMLRRALDVG
jgi:hypothetical protein